MGFSKEEAERLNADHHRRMSADSRRRSQHEAKKAATLDGASRYSLVEAMLGAQSRFELQAERPTLLELGAGRGQLRQLLCTELGATEYVGVEVVADVAAASPHVSHMAFEEGPARGWNSRFDFIFSRHVMEHVTDVDVAMKALKQMLAPKGIIGAVTPHYFPDPEPAHVTQLRIDEWMAAYERNGLKPVYAMEKSFACDEAHLVIVHSEVATGL